MVSDLPDVSHNGLFLKGAVIISTPQDIALKDAVKGINMFKKTNIPILGMVQNMSTFVCPHCQTSTQIFGTHDGVSATCEKHGFELLADVPLHARICDDADRGKPTVVAEPQSERAMILTKLADNIGIKLGLM